MVSFRKSLMVVALLALCAGLVMAQTTNTTKVIVVRAEGVTEPIDNGGIVLNSTLPAAALPAGFLGTGFYNFTLFSNTTNITSNPGKNDGATGEITLNAGGGAVHGVINAGSTSVTFTNVKATPTAWVAGSPASFTVTIKGIRVNASLLTTGGPVVASGVSFTVFALPQDNLTPAALFATSNGGSSPIFTAENVAYAISTLTVGATKDVVNKNFTFDQSATPGGTLSNPTATTPYFSPIFTINFTESYSKSFLSPDKEKDDSVDTTLVTNGTRLQATFTGFPAGTQLWVPNGVISGTVSAILVLGPDADGSNGKLATKLGPTDYTAVTQGTPVVYEIFGSNISGIGETLAVPVAVSFTVANPALSAIAGSVSANYAPLSSVPGASATAAIPRFGSSPQTIAGGYYGINACTSQLLFPYVSTGGGWDTGLAISNTGLTPSSTNALGGTCAFSFYAATGAPAAPVAFGAAGFGDTTAIASGTTAVGLASAAVPAGGAFTGYAYAVCNFKSSQGFAFPFAPEARGYISAGYLSK